MPLRLPLPLPQSVSSSTRRAGDGEGGRAWVVGWRGAKGRKRSSGLFVCVFVLSGSVVRRWLRTETPRLLRLLFLLRPSNPPTHPSTPPHPSPTHAPNRVLVLLVIHPLGGPLLPPALLLPRGQQITTTAATATTATIVTAVVVVVVLGGGYAQHGSQELVAAVFRLSIYRGGGSGRLFVCFCLKIEAHNHMTRIDDTFLHM